MSDGHSKGSRYIGGSENQTVLKEGMRSMWIYKIFQMEKELLSGCKEAINEGRDLNEEEKLCYEAFVAVQNLRKYLMGEGAK